MLAAIRTRDGTGFGTGPQAVSDELDLVTAQLTGRESLLLIDNCEHLIDAVARLVAALLSRCPELRVLATSREPLAIDGEALVPLGPLGLPEVDAGLEHLRRAASVRLFVERAGAVRPGFDIDEENAGDVAHVVTALDGMPLALELAAARLRTLSLSDLVAGLADRFEMLTTGSRVALPRHRTLRAVIAWSWELLAEHERTVAERIAVLPVGVTPASATALCAGTAVPVGEIAELLAALVDRSLLELAPVPGRYRMLETLREYGTSRLSATGDLAAVRELAAAYFTELVVRYDSRLRGPGQVQTIRILGTEYDNILATLHHLCDSGESTRAASLALHLSWYWQMFGRHPDASYWLGRALAVPGGHPTPERDCAHAIYLLNRAAGGADTEDTAPSRELLHRLRAHPQLPSPYGVVTALLQAEPVKLAIIESAAGGDDVWLSGLAHLFRAQIAENGGDPGRTRIELEAALTCFTKAGDSWGQATVLPMRAQLRQYDGDLDGALADLREARVVGAAFGDLGLGDQMTDMQWIDLHLRRGDTAPAIAMIDAVRERVRRTASAQSTAMIDVREAGFRVRLGDLDRARELLDNADRSVRSDTTSSGGHLRTLADGVRTELRLVQGDLAGAQDSLAAAYTAALATRDLPLLSVVAVNAAALDEAGGRPYDAAVLLGAAARLRGAHDPTDPQVHRLTRRAQASLGEHSFAAAYAKGRNLDEKAAIAEIDPARLRRKARRSG